MSQKPLHSLERRLVQTLSRIKEGSIDKVAEEAGISLDQARRAVEWLRSKGMVDVETELKRLILLDEEGVKALEQGLPERRLVDLLAQMDGRALIEDLRTRFKATPEEFSAALGRARRLGWVKVEAAEGGAVVEAVEAAHSTPEEELIRRIAGGGVVLDRLSSEEKLAALRLSKRPGFVKEKVVKTVRVRLTALGLEVAGSLKGERQLEALTPDLLTSGRWRGYTLRPLDVEAPAPPIYPGKKHPVQRFIDEVREIFVSLGFEEVDGPIVQPCFWNFDALFIPQDHPARDMQDTFYISGVGAYSLDEESVRAVSRVHEDGGETGSKGWGYRWSVERAKDLVLRTHTTAVTVRYLADHKPDEARVFSVGRVFRNEKATFKHLAEFYQIEGIAVGEKVSLRDLMGLLSSFYAKLGLKRVKFWPTFFPYTEPSLQSMVYFEGLNRWVELCGMGIFRPEVTLPLGVRNPVLAWGGGLERLVMLRYGISDIRELYENNLSWLRRIPICL